MLNIHTYISVFVFILVSNCPASSSVIPIYTTHNSSCNSTHHCNPNSFLACISGTCQCESPSNQVYVPSENICRSTIGGQCSLTLENGETSQERRRPCIENAECVTVSISSVTGSNYTECRCKENYMENSTGSCVLGIGQPCHYGPDECNPLGMIVCKDNRCQCMDNLQVYDAEFNRCVSPVGTHCKLDSLQLGCVKNAMCYPFYYWVPPKCLCKPGYVQDGYRNCVPDHSSSL